MRKIAGRIAKFRINPGTYNPYKPAFGHYYHVHIFDSSENLWSYGYRRTKQEKNREGYEALTIPIWRERYDSKQDLWLVAPKVGDVLFHKESLNTMVIAHESVHLATCFLRLLNKLRLGEQIDDDEELLAYCVCSIAQQIVDKLFESKIF